MIKQYFMGIDNGGTLTKAVIFDRDGNEIAKSAESVPLITPKAGYTERNMDELFAANCRCISQAVKLAGIPPSNIVGVSCTGHGKGLYLWGKNGKPAYNGIVSTDTRAWEYPLRWRQDGTADRVFEKTCQQVLASQPVSLLNWLKDYEPDVLPQIQWVFSVKDYIRFRLTGLAYGEVTDVSGSNLVNLHTASYDEDLLREFGLEALRGCLPPLRYSNEPCGTITAAAAAATGLAEGTPVSGGMFDIDACAVAMDVTEEEKLCVIAGTWGINEYIAKEPVMNKTVMMNSLFCLPGYYLVEESSPTSAGNHEWFTKMFLRELEDEARKRKTSVYRIADELAAQVHPQDQNIVFLPFLYGSNYNPQARAALVGLDSSHTKAQIIRAVLEGIVFCHMEHIDKLLLNRPKPTAIRLAGGAAKSPLWVQIFADILDCPIEVIATEELGALGCAMSAAVAAGAFSDLKEAAKQMVRVKACINPVAEHVQIYREKRKLYQQVAKSLETVWGGF